MRPIPVNDPAGFEIIAAETLGIAGWYARLGHNPSFPMSIDQACELLSKGGEYAIDRGQLEDLVSRSIVTAPSDGLWRASDVVQAGAVLEARRQWAPSPSTHDLKKSSHMLSLEAARSVDDLSECFAGCPRLDTRHLLILLTECESRELRERLLAAVMAEAERTFGVRI